MSIKDEIRRYEFFKDPKPVVTEEYPLKRWSAFVQATVADLYPDIVDLFSDDLVYPSLYDSDEGLLPWSKSVQEAVQETLLTRLLDMDWMGKFGGQKRIEGICGTMPQPSTVRKMLIRLYRKKCTYNSNELLRASAAAVGLRELYNEFKRYRRVQNACIRAASGPGTSDEVDSEDDLYNAD
jgi:hypothetical protein